MRFREKFILVVAVFALALSPAARAEWLLYADTLIQASEEIQKHPKSASHVIFPREALENPLACVGYTNNLAKKGKGRVITDVLVMKADGTEISKRLVAGIKKNTALACKELEIDLEEGDAVHFAHDLRNFPRLRNNETRLDFAEITSIISTNGEPQLGHTAPLGWVPEKGAAPYGVLPLPGAGRYRAARSVFQVDDDKVSQKHPELVERTLIVQKDLEGSSVCVAYSNMAEDANAGRILATVNITRPEVEEVETFKIIGGVKDNTFLKCKEAEGAIPVESIVDFSVELRGMDRLKNDGDVIAFADLTSLVTTTGEPVFREPPPPPPPPVTTSPDPAPSAPSTPSDPAPPSGGNGISAADEAAAVRLFNAKAVQLQRPKGDSPGRFLAVGPKTTLLPGSGHKVDPKTTGVGSTIAAAVADYEKKHKTNFPSGGSLNSTERSLLAWYGGMNSTNGPTSVRRDNKGRFHGEYFRPSKGSQHKTHNTLTEALDWLKKQGL